MKRCASHWRFVAAGCLTVLGTAAGAANLAVTVDNIEEDKGVLRVAVYKEPNWLDEDSKNVTAGKVYDLTERRGDEPVVVNLDLEPGEYGAVVYHDVNTNNQFDKNLLGIPKEPYAFSLCASKFRRPKFEECKFEVGEDGAAITLSFKE
ncbi:MAG: DUF2141 domain-containing protein [Pseudomonadales bacterium]|nr:DUF2141 domain-containing protein [Pseudomonadales bacterium]